MRTVVQPGCRAIIQLVSVAVGLSFLPGRSAGQSEPVLFVHGYGQTSASWNPMIADLEARHPINGFPAYLDSREPEVSQAIDLASYLSSYGLMDVAGITHSNGGLVLREYVRTSGSPRVNRHLSLGTPHLGAPLADAVISGALADWALSIGGYILSPVSWYAVNDPDWHWIDIQGSSTYYAESMSSAVYELLTAALPAALANLGFLVNNHYSPWHDVVYDLSPSSSFMAALNTSGALSNEAQLMPSARVSISTRYPADLGLWRSISINDWTALQWQWAVYDLEDFAYDAYWYYTFHWDFDLSANAWRWLDMLYALASIPYDWQVFTGGVTPGWSDGVVPEWSSEYPGNTESYVLPTAQLYLHHVAQLDGVPDHDEDAFRVLVSQAIEEDLGIVAPEPLIVSISGPGSIQSNDLYQWTAEVSGGTGEYTYEWYRKTDYWWPRSAPTCHYQTDWELVGSGDTYSSFVQAGMDYDFRLRLTVHSGGEVDSQEQAVLVGDGSLPCPEKPEACQMPGSMP